MAYYRTASARAGAGFITQADRADLAFSWQATIDDQVWVYVDGKPNAISAWASRVGAIKAIDLGPLYAYLDAQTDAAIGAALHRVAPIGEQIGILRDQLVQILNALGMEPTADFARLYEVAVKAIEAARAKKEAL